MDIGFVKEKSNISKRAIRALVDIPILCLGKEGTSGRTRR